MGPATVFKVLGVTVGRSVHGRRHTRYTQFCKQDNARFIYFHFRSNRVELTTATRRVGNNFGAGNIIILHIQARPPWPMPRVRLPNEMILSVG